jgi:rRNA processing protein Krr1/Pno1
MTQEIYIESIRKVMDNKDILEKELQVKITNKGKNVFVDGDGDKEFIAINVLEALHLGFSLDTALLLKDEEIIFQILNIKDLTKRKDLHEVRARIIGTYRKTLDNLENLSECAICLHENKVGIIGKVDNISDAIIALKSIIQGSKQGNVYARLERERKKKRLSPKEIIKNEFKK